MKYRTHGHAISINESGWKLGPKLECRPGRWADGVGLWLGDFIQIIRPPLQHFMALGEVVSPVIGGSDFIGRAVGKLTFDNVRLKAALVQNRAGGGANTMHGGLAMIAHTVHRIEQGIA